MANPRDYIPGDPESIQYTIDDLNTMATNYRTLYDAVRGVSSKQEWSGKAAEAARKTLSADLPEPWRVAAEAHEKARDALKTYKAALVAAQGKAQTFLNEQERGNRASRDWDGEGADPGDAIRANAHHILADAQNSVVDAGNAARALVREAADTAPSGPGLFEMIGRFFVDLAEKFAYGATASGVGMLNLGLLTLNPISILGGAGQTAAGLGFLLRDMDGSDVDAIEHLFDKNQDNMFFDLFRPDPGVDQDWDDVLWADDLNGTIDYHDQTARGEIMAANKELTGTALAVAQELGCTAPVFDTRSGLYVVQVPESLKEQMRAAHSGGLTVGNVFFSFDAQADIANTSLMMHEWKHARQWAALGPVGFVEGYFPSLLINRHFDPDADGPFEQAANYRDGGYVGDRKNDMVKLEGDPFAVLSELRRR
jgi:hypothetical protein